MKCPDLHNRLSAYQDRELAADKAQDIAKHLEVCDICRKEYKTLQIIDSLLNELPEITVSDAFHEKLKKNLNRQQHRTKPGAPIRNPLLFIKTIIESILLSILKKPSSRNDALEEFYDLPPNSMGRIFFTLI